MNCVDALDQPKKRDPASVFPIRRLDLIFLEIAEVMVVVMDEKKTLSALHARTGCRKLQCVSEMKKCDYREDVCRKQ